jgi:hypothetical protein
MLIRVKSDNLTLITLHMYMHAYGFVAQPITGDNFLISACFLRSRHAKASHFI